MLKTVSKEEMYLICARLKNQAVLSKQKMRLTSGEHLMAQEVMTVCNEMIDLLDRMTQLKLAVKLEDLMKEIHNHLHNH